MALSMEIQLNIRMSPNPVSISQDSRALTPRLHDYDMLEDKGQTPVVDHQLSWHIRGPCLSQRKDATCAWRVDLGPRSDVAARDLARMNTAPSISGCKSQCSCAVYAGILFL